MLNPDARPDEQERHFIPAQFAFDVCLLEYRLLGDGDIILQVKIIACAPVGYPRRQEGWLVMIGFLRE